MLDYNIVNLILDFLGFVDVVTNQMILSPDFGTVGRNKQIKQVFKFYEIESNIRTVPKKIRLRFEEIYSLKTQGKYWNKMCQKKKLLNQEVTENGILFYQGNL